jgi:hypothetical protein
MQGLPSTSVPRSAQALADTGAHRLLVSLEFPSNAAPPTVGPPRIGAAPTQPDPASFDDQVG